MKGAIIGDIVGSVYEHDNIRSKDFPLFQPHSRFTDDTVMTVAVANALMRSYESEAPLFDELVASMQSFGRDFPHRGYGGHFKKWIRDPRPQPYGSYGNGAPMRASAAGWITDDPRKAYQIGEATALPTHDHSEAMKASGLTAELICRARAGDHKAALRDYALRFYEIPPLDKMRRWYYFDVSSQGTMPAALSAFFESTDFEDAIRNAVSLGGDSDTVAAITGSIAEAYYGVPEELWAEAEKFLDGRLLSVVDAFYGFAKEVR